MRATYSAEVDPRDLSVFPPPIITAAVLHVSSQPSASNHAVAQHLIPSHPPATTQISHPNQRNFRPRTLSLISTPLHHRPPQLTTSPPPTCPPNTRFSWNTPHLYSLLLHLTIATSSLTHSSERTTTRRPTKIPTHIHLPPLLPPLHPHHHEARLLKGYGARHMSTVQEQARDCRSSGDLLG